MLSFLPPKPLLAMLHAPPLPGSPRYDGDFAAVQAAVLRDAETLAAGSVDGLILENFGDVPFFPHRMPAATIAAMTVLAAEIRRRIPLPLGVNVLRNDGQAALAVAAAVGAEFIRVNVLCGARVTDQGIVEGIAHSLLRRRAALRAERVRILADVDVKHSASLANRPIEEEAEETLHRGGADALIVSGRATGHAADPRQVLAVKLAAGEAPVLVGSGVTAETVAECLAAADGAVVGTWLKRDGRVENPVDPVRVETFVRAARGRT